MNRALNRAIAAAMLAAAGLPVYADGGARYVGGGRFVCHDNSASCAMVKQNNKILSRIEREARKPAPYVAPDPTFSGRGQGYGYSVPAQSQPAPIILEPKASFTPRDFFPQD